MNLATVIFDEILDHFYINNYKLYDPKVCNILVEKQVGRLSVRLAIGDLVVLQDELRDPDAAEGYRRLSRKQKNNYIAFLDRLIEGAWLYLDSSSPRKPRKKRLRCTGKPKIGP